MVGCWASSTVGACLSPLHFLSSGSSCRGVRHAQRPPVTLRPQSALPSGHQLGENLLPIRLYFLCALALAASERAFCILVSQAQGSLDKLANNE